MYPKKVYNLNNFSKANKILMKVKHPIKVS